MASGGGGNSGTQTTQVQLPSWIEDAGKSGLSTAQGIANTPYQAYTGDRVAGQTPDQLQAADAIRNMQGQTGTALQGLGDKTAAMGSWQPSTVTPQTLAGTDLAPYMNPYTGEVETNALKALESSRQGAQNQISDAFVSNKAFGGSRQALQSAVTDSLTAQKAAETSAQLRQANFNQAQTAATGDITRDLQGQQLNQAAGISGQGLDLQALKNAGDLYNTGQAADIRDVGLLDTSGQGQQAAQQAGLDLDYQNWLEQQNYPKSQTEWLSQILGATPYGQGSTQSGTFPSSRSNPLMGALGGAASGAAIGSVVPVYGSAVGAVAGGLLGGLSSR